MPKNPDGSGTIETIGDLIDDDYTLTVYCQGAGCHRSAEVDKQALADRIGRDHSYLAKDLKPHFRCSKCGSKDIEFVLTAFGDEHGVDTARDMPDF